MIKSNKRKISWPKVEEAWSHRSEEGAPTVLLTDSLSVDKRAGGCVAFMLVGMSTNEDSMYISLAAQLSAVHLL